MSVPATEWAVAALLARLGPAAGCGDQRVTVTRCEALTAGLFRVAFEFADEYDRCSQYDTTAYWEGWALLRREAATGAVVDGAMRLVALGESAHGRAGEERRLGPAPGHPG